MTKRVERREGTHPLERAVTAIFREYAQQQSVAGGWDVMDHHLIQCVQEGIYSPGYAIEIAAKCNRWNVLDHIRRMK